LSSTMKVYQLSDIERVTSSSAFETSLLDAIADGFVSYSRGEFNACPIQTMGAPPMGKFSCASGSSHDSEYAAQVCIKSGYVTGADHFVVKVASGGYPMPSNSGCMQVYSQHTGKLEALLLDDGILTELRTAAAGAVAAKYMAPKELKRIGMLGTGIQARYQLRLLKHVTECRDLMVYGRTDANVRKYVDDCKSDGWTVTVASGPNDLLDKCELIVTTTTAREPVLGIGGRRSAIPEQHITCIGADAPGKMELDVDLVKSANVLVADSRLQTKERGEFEKAVKDRLVSVEDILEIGELAQMPILPSKLGGVTSHEEYSGLLSEVATAEQSTEHGVGMSRCKALLSGMIQNGPNFGLSIFDSSGVAVQDCVIAGMVYSALAAAEGRS